MKKKNNKILLFSILWILVIFSSCGSKLEDPPITRSEKPKQSNNSNEPKEQNQLGTGKKVMNIPISRAMVAKMIALTFNDLGDIMALDREIQFEDTDPNQWYDPYINTVVIQGFMQGTDVGFAPLDPLTMEQANLLLQRIASDVSTSFVSFSAKNRKQPISYSQWVEAYLNCLEKGRKDQSLQEAYGLTKKNIIVIGTPANTSSLPSWSMGTDQGIYGFTGLAMDSYMDQKIQVLLKGNEILAFLGVVEENPTITHAYIQNTEQEQLTIFIGGIQRTYACEESILPITGNIADLTLQQGKVVQVKGYQEEVRDRILQVGGNHIELAQHKKLPVWEDMKVYSTVGETPTWKGKSALLVGTQLARFILKEGKICAAIIDQTPTLSNIRVALHTTDFAGLFHPEVKITSSQGFVVQRGKEEISYEGGQVLDMGAQKEWDWAEIPRIYIRPQTPEGRIEIQSIIRGWGENRKSPVYRGVIEVAKEESGYTIVNEVGMEEYLYSVVPSEMPTAHGLEAAKVQAVTARSYAHAQMYANRYHSYGGHVDDSTSCQVYNNTPENPVSIQAVNETQGQGLTFQGSVISANFFSTSSGYTANSGEVWAHYQTQTLPSHTPSYLVSKKQYEGPDFGDMTQEENAYRFFKTKEINGYDEKFRWFRWQVTMTREELTASIEANLKERYNAKPKLIKTLDENKVFRIRPVESIGELQDIQVYKRGQGGNIMELVLIGTEKTIKVTTEYNIRFLLRPQQYLKEKGPILLTQGDGTQVSDFSAMPSSFFVMDKNRDATGKLQSITFYGGGYGHGVGMSQNGVKGMVDKGYTYEQILQHYYPGTEIKQIFKPQ